MEYITIYDTDILHINRSKMAGKEDKDTDELDEIKAEIEKLKNSDKS